MNGTPAKYRRRLWRRVRLTQMTRWRRL